VKKSVKTQISKVLGGNNNLNKNAIRVKRSWDEVAAILSKGKAKPKS
jgi:hypothetical protein